MSSPARRVVVLTALEVEYEAVRRHLTHVQPRVHRGSYYELGRVNTADGHCEVLLAEIGAGNPTAAAETERAIGYFRPELALFVGVAGGLKDVKLGDVVAAQRVHHYHSAKASTTVLPRPTGGDAPYEAVQAARAVRRAWNRERSMPARAFVGSIAAGEQVVAATRSTTYEFIRAQYGDALAVEMEGYGFLAASHMTATPCLVIRGISDLIDGKAESDAEGSQETAAANAALFALHFLQAYRPGDRLAAKSEFAADIRGWLTAREANGALRVFLSSRLTPTLRKTRAALARSVESLGVGIARVWMWERNGSEGPSAADVCLAVAGECDVVVLLIDGDVSPIVQAEYRTAVSNGARCFAFTRDGSHRKHECAEFLGELAIASHDIMLFRNDSELITQLVRRLRVHLRSADRHSRRP